MKPDAKVFELVKKLSSSEKRYYSLMQAKEEAGKSHIGILFEALCTLHEHSDVYDEAWLHAYLREDGNEGIVHNFVEVKTDLYTSILKVMRSYNARRNADILVYDMVEDARFALSKGLYEQAKDLLKRAHTTATRYESVAGLLEVLRLERRLLYDRADTQLAEKIEDLVSREKTALRSRQVEYTLQHTYDHMFSQLHLQRAGYTVDGEVLRALLEHPVFESDRTEHTFAAQCLYFAVMALYYRIQQCDQLSFIYEKECIELWRSHSKYIQNTPQAFMRELAMYIGSCIRLGKKQEFAEAMQYWKTIPCRTADDEAERFQNEAFLQVLYALHADATHVAEQEVQPLVTGLEKFEGRILPARVLAICYNYMLVFFLLGRYRKALQWCNELFDRRKYTARVDLLIASHLIDPLLHYGLGDNELVDNRCRAAVRSIQRHRELYPYEREFLLFVRKLPDLVDKEKREKRARAMQQRIRDEALPNALVQEILLWLESVASGRSLRELFMEQQKNNAYFPDSAEKCERVTKHSS